MVKKTLLIPCLLLLFVRVLSAQSDDFTQGEELFMQNKPEEARVFLERATARDPSNVKAFLYLGIACQQLDMVDEAIAAYRKILPRAGTETARIAYNLGNAYYTKGNTDLAEQYYTQAIKEDSSYASAYLNRGNTRIKAGAFQSAIPDYEEFLTLEPRSPQRPKIEQLMAFIREELAGASGGQAVLSAGIVGQQTVIIEGNTSRDASGQSVAGQTGTAETASRDVAGQQPAQTAGEAEQQRIAVETASQDATGLAAGRQTGQSAENASRDVAGQTSGQQPVQTAQTAEEAERQRIAAETAARDAAGQTSGRQPAEPAQTAEEAERQRIAAENAARDAAERRQRLMDELSASLQSASGKTTGLSAGSEGVLSYEGEFELE